MVAGFAHDLGSPLQAIISMAELIERQSPRTDPLDAARRISRAALRARGMIHDLIGYAREEPFERTRVSAMDAVLDALELDRYASTEETAVRVEAPEDGLFLWAHPQRLTQILVNLIANARHAVDAEGAGCIRVRFEAPEALGDEERTGAIVVENEGTPIPKRIADRLFEHGFTTKSPGQGSGIGLSISRRLAELMGGSLRHDASWPKGTRMILQMQRATPHAQEDAGSTTRTRIESPTTILIVDDDEELLESYTAILSFEGFHVLSTTRARDALNLLNKQSVDVILCDYHLPDLSAPHFHQALLKVSPAMAQRVIYATGDEVNESVNNFFRQVQTPKLLKPFLVEQLLATIALVIDEPKKGLP
jgi:two-component system NtrC family sensor kinase